MRSRLPAAPDSGSVTPQLEGAPRSIPHPVRRPRGGGAIQEKKEDGRYA
jgi:hypothetical protein